MPALPTVVASKLLRSAERLRCWLQARPGQVTRAARARAATVARRRRHWFPVDPSLAVSIAPAAVSAHAALAVDEVRHCLKAVLRVNVCTPAVRHLKPQIGHNTAGAKPQSAPNQHGHQVEHITRQEWHDGGRKNTREMDQNNVEVFAVRPCPTSRAARPAPGRCYQ